MLLANIRYGIRLMLRHPAFGIAAVGVISMGIGATTAVFTLIRAVLLTPLPYPDPGRLVTIQAQAPSLPGRSPLTMAEFNALRERTDLFESSRPRTRRKAISPASRTWKSSLRLR